jgi:hypothetical protein
VKRALVLPAVLFALASTAIARDRPLELFLGDMSPSGSRACMRDIGRELRSRDHEPMNVTRVGEPSVRRMVGDEDGAFIDWTEEDLRPIVERRREVPYDAIALVDCREGDGSAQLLLYSASHELARIVMRETPIDEERARWLGRTLVMHAFLGFDP